MKKLCKNCRFSRIEKIQDTWDYEFYLSPDIIRCEKNKNTDNICESYEEREEEK